MIKSKTELLRVLLANAGIPHFELVVFGNQIKVVTLTEENRARWIAKLETIATIQKDVETTAQEKKRKGDWFQAPPVKAFKIVATLKEVKP